MRKLIAFAFVLFSLGASAQSLQYSTTYGYRYRRLLVDSISGLPSDTFRIPTALRSKVWLAGKSGTGTLYVWNTTNLRWEAISGGGGGVSDGNKGDITVSGSSSVWTINNSSITNAKIRDAVALSILGRSANSTGSIADIVAGSDGNVLRRSGTSIGFGTISLANSNTVTGLLADANISSASTWNAKISNITGLVSVGGLTTLTGTGVSGDPYKVHVDSTKFDRIDTTRRRDKNFMIAVYDKRIPGSTYYPVDSIATTSSSSTYVAPKLIQFIIGETPNAPPVGDSIVVHDSLVGKFATIFRDGKEQYYNKTSNGYQFTSGTGTVTVHPPFASGEYIKIYRTTAAPDTITPQTPPVPWQYMAFTSPTLFTNTSNVYTAGSGSGWGSYALGTTSFVGDMSIRVQHVSSAQEYIVGLKTANTAGDYTGYAVGFAVSGGTLYRLEAGASGTLSYSVSANEYIRIVRSGSTFLIQVSMDGSTWTTKHTSSYSSSATHYVNLNLYAQSPLGKAYYMMYK